MITLLAEISTRLTNALKVAFGDAANGIEPTIVSTTNATFGDYQTNLALLLSRPLKQSPRAIAEKILKELNLSDLCEAPEIAGAGFINLRIKKSYLESQLNNLVADERLGIKPVQERKKVLVEYSSPNIAKQMGVHHLRGTIIGDALANVHEFLGFEVLRISHVGDWGTQFGMLIAYLKAVCPEAMTKENAVHIGDIEAFYKKAKLRFDQDEVFADMSRKEVVLLQSGDADSLKAWRLLCEQSRRDNEAIYKRLQIHQLEERGESLYNPMLPGIVSDLESLGLAVENQGAKCVFVEGFTNEGGELVPLIVQKSDGGYNYDTTDLAALRSRLLNDKADRIIYVVDASQSEHFAKFFKVAKLAGWLINENQVVHVAYGVVQGTDGKKLKTRSGDAVKLRELLEEAKSRAQAELEARLSKDDRKESFEFIDTVAERIAMGGIKYADLSLNRMTNYIFDFDKMLSLQGNTAPYMMYAYVRVRGIGRKAEVKDQSRQTTNPIKLTETYEIELGKHILRFDEVLKSVLAELLPNRICDYLFELSQKFNQFYENCPVLNAESDIRASRLALCDLTAHTIKVGLDLLGISVPERM